MKPNAMQMLSAMNQAQAKQLMAANLLAIACCMKKAGLSEITINQEEIRALIEPGETLEPIQNVDGGFTYRFVKVQPVLAKLPLPVGIAGKSTKKKSGKRTTADGAVHPSFD